MAKKNTKPKRPPISARTQLQLWVASAGRCQFPGCDESVLKDSTTLSEGNYANIAHIISWTPTGPRGDAILSPKLGKDISNLMLMCLRHGKMIDIKKNIPTYTVDFLRKCKEDHESRIKIQTSIDASRKTTAVRLQTNIRGRLVVVSQSDVYTALVTAGRYPHDEKGIHVDLTNLNYSADKSSWETATKQIDATLASVLTIGNDGRKENHFSVFGIAPIPLLAYLGFKLGNTTPADIYIKRREKPWSRISSDPKLELTLVKPRSKDRTKAVALSVAISGTTSRSEIEKHLGKGVPVYEIKLKKSQIDQIECIEDLEVFRKIYREIIDEIRELCGKKCKIHVFGAMPTCAAIVCGREIIHGVDPTFVMYEHLSQEEGFIPALTFN
ncbi:SAVED domain-containing protein [Candidatus Woesebacteria bacterium]|nr:SAVED domain-containing protein [Candidatus Woesebacteria bacterium]